MMSNPKGQFMHGDRSWFAQARLGLFIHWGIYALPARHEWVKSREKLTDDQYQPYFDHFDPDLYDPRKWARVAREAGMKYFVITTKHHDGFCLWDSQLTDYKATNTPCGRDVLKPMVEAFREEGLKVGFYHSLLDWHHPDFTVDRPHPRSADEEARAANKERDMRRYTEYLHGQVRELLTQYGKIDIIWFDFSYPHEDGKGREDWQSQKLVELVRELQPGILINNRLDLPGSEDFITPEQYVPAEPPVDEDGQAVLWEGCQTFSGAWGYHRDETSWKSLPMVVQMLVEHVAMGGNLLLNVGPTARGEFDERALHRLFGLGEWMHRHGRAIYDCGPAPDGLRPPPDCRYTYNAATRRLYVHFFRWPFKAVHLPGLAGRVRYAQLLNDASEVRFRQRDNAIHSSLNAKTPEGAVTLELPVRPPDEPVPVVELFLSQ